MAIDALTAITPNDLAAYPNNAAINATSPSATDGTPLTAIGMNNYWHGRQQALLNYAGLTPTGVVESDTVSQEIEAIQKGFGVIPGRVFRRDTFDDPSVFGDRSILLASGVGGSVLIVAYVPLDAAVYVGDANNAAVHAAGGYYYRSSDAGGATPNIAGPYLQLPPNPFPIGLRQYLGDGTDFSVTGTAGFSLVRAVAIPYTTIDGTERILGNIDYSFTSTASPNVTISGVTFKTGATQTFSVGTQVSDFGRAYTTAGSGAVVVRIGTAGTTNNLYFDVELDSIPTWAKVFDIKHAITY